MRAVPLETGVASRTAIEQSVNVVRCVLAALAGVTIMTAGASKTQTDAVGPVVVAAAVGAATTIVVLVSRRLICREPSGRWGLVVVHLLDVGLFVALAGALETYVTDASWALFVVPIVLAPLRFNDLAVVGTWLLGSVGYTFAGQAGWIERAADPKALLGRIGVLLAVAASVALLTRWLQEGWRNQGMLTKAAEQRIARLATIENAARAMRNDKAAEVIATCTANIPLLGFESATATSNGEVIAVAGRDGLAPAETSSPDLEAGQLYITRWTTQNEPPLYSVSTIETFSGTMLTAWQADQIDDDLAHALQDLVANATNALEAARHLEHARHEATHDPLTGLANRAKFNDHLELAAADTEPVGLLYLDLDNFKIINDTHGHSMGDKVLVTVAKRLTRAIADGGLVARLGGDEFAILLSGTAAAYTSKLARDLNDVLATPIVIGDLQLIAAASIGAASETGPVDPADLIEKADAAAYAVKRSNRYGADLSDASAKRSKSVVSRRK